MVQEFETTLIPQDIVVRQDNGESTFLEENGGFWFPLIRIKDVVFHKEKIASYSYSFGADLLPRVSVTLNDFNKSFMEVNFPKVDDIITIRVSNNEDTIHKPIKLDFLIIDIDSSPSSRAVTIDAIQYVPKLHEFNNVGWNDSLYNITKDIAKKCGLGFVTNMKDSNDVSNWICPNNFYDYLNYIEERMFISEDDSCKIFIDQFNNLNVLSLKTCFNDRNKTKLLTNPSSGLPYDTNTIVKLSNKEYNSNIEGEEDYHVQVNQWSPFSNYGYGFIKSKSIATYSQKNSELHLNVPETTPINVQNINALENSSIKEYGTYVDSETVYKDILVTKKQNKRLIEIYKQGTYVTADLEFYIPDIYSYMYVPVELYNKRRTSNQVSQDDNKDVNELSNEDTKYTSNVITELNKEFSGDYLIRSTQFLYSSSRSGNETNLRQRVVMIKL